MSELNIDEQAEVVAEFLRGLADRFGVPGTETAIERVEEDTVEVRLQGGDLGLRIGPKGQTLHLIQELARTTVQRRGGGIQEGRIRIDIAGYRQRRREAPRAVHPAGGGRRGRPAATAEGPASR